MIESRGFARRRRRLVGALALGIGHLGAHASAMAVMVADRIEPPPPRREFTSADGRYRLVIEALDGWKKFAAQATLQRLHGGSTTTVWTQRIAQEFGPRAALVANDGRVLMLDEGINVRSRYALMLFDPQGKIEATHDFDSLMRTAQASNADIMAHARSGTWMGPPATLAPGGAVAHIPFAGRVLAVSLADGSLSLAR